MVSGLYARRRQNNSVKLNFGNKQTIEIDKVKMHHTYLTFYSNSIRIIAPAPGASVSYKFGIFFFEVFVFFLRFIVLMFINSLLYVLYMVLF
jgi:hypothetical protein